MSEACEHMIVRRCVPFMDPSGTNTWKCVDCLVDFSQKVMPGDITPDPNPNTLLNMLSSHHRSNEGPWCFLDGHAWPCPSFQAATQIHRLRTALHSSTIMLEGLSMVDEEHEATAIADIVATNIALLGGK